jgi:site-specific recombinase XerD
MDISIEAAFAEFLLAAAADGLRPASLKWYGAILRPMVEQFAGQAIGDVTVSAMRQYIVGLRTRTQRYANDRSDHPKIEGGLSEDSIASHIRALHRFWHWSSVEYQIGNPMQNIKRPKPKQPDPKGINLEDFKLLFGATSNDVAGARDKAILAFLIDSNCRANGLITLTLENLNIEQGWARVLEKGGITRKVYFNFVTANLLSAWGEVRPGNAGNVFCSLSNRTYGDDLSYEGLVQLLLRLKAKAGVRGRVNPHSFRHGFAREYITGGGDLGTLSSLMGHSSVEVTAWYYAVFTPDELQKFHTRYSPAQSVLDELTKIESDSSITD